MQLGIASTSSSGISQYVLVAGVIQASKHQEECTSCPARRQCVPFCAHCDLLPYYQHSVLSAAGQWGISAVNSAVMCLALPSNSRKMNIGSIQEPPLLKLFHPVPPPLRYRQRKDAVPMITHPGSSIQVRHSILGGDQPCHNCLDRLSTFIQPRSCAAQGFIQPTNPGGP